MLKQPENSKLCGQCCLAVILGISLEESIALVGHKHGTTTKELIKHFRTKGDKLIKVNINKLGKPAENKFENDNSIKVNPNRPNELNLYFKNSPYLEYLPSLSYSLCRVHFGKEKFTHWVLYSNDCVYDPVIGKYITYEKWKQITSKHNARITSSIEILDKD